VALGAVAISVADYCYCCCCCSFVRLPVVAGRRSTSRRRCVADSRCFLHGPRADRGPGARLALDIESAPDSTRARTAGCVAAVETATVALDNIAAAVVGKSAAAVDSIAAVPEERRSALADTNVREYRRYRGTRSG